jgi:hypothetical protein
MGSGIVQTASDELSMYYFENFRTDSCRIRRCTIRPDGFVSVSAGFEGGEFTTVPLLFQGNTLELNYSTSAVGSIQIEIQCPDGTPYPGLSIGDSPEIFGDEIARDVIWGTADIAKLALKPVRMRFVIKDADLYSFRFKIGDAA